MEKIFVAKRVAGKLFATEAAVDAAFAEAAELMSEMLKARQDINMSVGSSRVDLQACKLEYSIVSPK